MPSADYCFFIRHWCYIYYFIVKNEELLNDHLLSKQGIFSEWVDGCYQSPSGYKAVDVCQVGSCVFCTCGCKWLHHQLEAEDGDFASGKGLSYHKVTPLVKKDFLGSGYLIYCDSFYTSPLHLGQQGFWACGTYLLRIIVVPFTQENVLIKGCQAGLIDWIRYRHQRSLHLYQHLPCLGLAIHAFIFSRLDYCNSLLSNII